MRALGVEFNKEDILGLECKHAVYSKSRYRNNNPQDDLVFVKELVHLKDGRKVPRTRYFINKERPFWITKPGHRTHEEKKEWEDLDKLQKFTSTQADLENAIKRSLNLITPVGGLRNLAKTPYLYGADITITAITKHEYQRKWPECVSENAVAILDLETDVVHGHGEPIYAAITFKDKAVLCATRAFVAEFDDFETEMRAYFYKRLPDLAKERNIDLEVVVSDSPLQMITECINRAHAWQPDFLAIWNIDFDIPKIMDLIEKYNGNAAEIFSDPSVPREFQQCWYKKGPTKRVTASGKEAALAWYDQWHTLITPASFYVVDQASVFRKLRIAHGKEPSYALDSILKKYTHMEKLKNDQADQYSGLEWHIYMQQHMKLEYGVYNLVDCIGCEVLDEQPKVGDLRSSITALIGHSDYEKFDSQPRRTCDDLHFFCLDMGKVIATTPRTMKTEFDTLTVGLNNWMNR